jgi:hypothetical protein
MYLPLNEPEKKALLELARREDRDPRFQAARFVREGLERAGAFGDLKNAPAEPASAVPA